MIKRFFEWILDQTLGRMWRRHERSVRCDMAIQDRAADLDFALKKFGPEFKNQVDDMARDLFLDASASTYTDRPTEFTAETYGDLKKIIEAIKLKPVDDQLSMIIVTTVTMPYSMLKCRFEGRVYALIHPDDWEKVKASISRRPEDMPVSPLWGIPVVKNDDLALKVMIGAIMEGIESRKPGSPEGMG